MSLKGTSERYLRFLVGFSPVLFVHAVIPPMSVMYGTEKRILPISSLPLRFIERHLVYSRAAVRGGRWYTSLTYMLVHSDYAHLAKNMLSLVLAGPTVVDSVGLSGALVLYAGAGVLSAIDPFSL